MKARDFAFHLTNFLTVYLPGQKGLRTNTILSYRDAFVLFLRFCQESKGIPVEKLNFSHMDKKLVEDYLSWLEQAKGTSIASRNQRLAALRSFFKHVQTEAPEHLSLCQSIISIDTKKHAKPIVSFLTQQGIQTLLAQPSTNTLCGRRDLTMLETLYDSAARVQEICDLIVDDLRLNAPPTLRLTGKGGKVRHVPLSAPVASLLKQYVQENKLDAAHAGSSPLFPNRMGQRLTRGGVGYILSKYADQARKIGKSDIPTHLTPHCLRHTKAMHLLQSGTNLIYIRDFLGHESIETTQIYARADPEIKRKAILAAYSDNPSIQLPEQFPSWNENPDLMNRLTALGRT